MTIESDPRYIQMTELYEGLMANQRKINRKMWDNRDEEYLGLWCERNTGYYVELVEYDGEYATYRCMVNVESRLHTTLAALFNRKFFRVNLISEE